MAKVLDKTIWEARAVIFVSATAMNLSLLQYYGKMSGTCPIVWWILTDIDWQPFRKSFVSISCLCFLDLQTPRCLLLFYLTGLESSLSFLQTRDLIVMTKVRCFRDGAVTLDECFKGLLCVQSLFFFLLFISTFSLVCEKITDGFLPRLPLSYLLFQVEKKESVE